MSTRTTLDANEAVARIAYATSEVIAIYPITPASPMGEWADTWQGEGRLNAWGSLPDVVEMQSEAGAAGAVHGALLAGAMATTFTASQGLLLMIPNMFKIAGELLPTVFHVAARTVATHALSIFGDHSDVMACRSTGWSMLCSSSVQEAADLALVAHAATLETRIPVLHFFDGFRTSHEVNTIELIDEAAIGPFLDGAAIVRHRGRGLSPDSPKLHGSAQNPDIFFQAREAINPFYDQTPECIQRVMNRLAVLTGRSYHLFDYYGATDAQRVVVMMGSGIGAMEEAIDQLMERGEKVGLIKVRLFRPFDVAAFGAALPATVQSIAVLDRVKEPGAVGEPLYQDVVTALHQLRRNATVVGGRYGLASKEFTPQMALTVIEHLSQDAPRGDFTVGIVDDVTGRSLKLSSSDEIRERADLRALFFGLGSDGTVGANKNSVKIIGQATDLFAQGYFVYDSKKSGAMTISHLRADSRPIRATYLIQQANFIACHQFSLLQRTDVLQLAEPGATVLLNSPFRADQVWDELPLQFQEIAIQRRLRLFVIDADAIARQVGLAGRINIAMQVAFFALTKLLPLDVALNEIGDAIDKTYGKKSPSIAEKNRQMVELALAGYRELTLPVTASSRITPLQWVPDQSPDFIKHVTAALMAGLGDNLPVSAMLAGGEFPTGTSRYEKRSLAVDIPEWDAELCTQCGLCSLVCPHAVIRTKLIPQSALLAAPENFSTQPWNNKAATLDDSRVSSASEARFSLQIAPDDCTGCGVCVDVCPARSKSVVRHKALDMQPKQPRLSSLRTQFDYFLQAPEVPRSHIDTHSLKGTQFLLPLMEYSGACAGCGETPYLRLISQLFGDRMIVANATGCSSIYGGNLPTTPWATNAEGRGPAWANSLFEDNAEFGLGIRLAVQHRRQTAIELLIQMKTDLSHGLSGELIEGLLHGSCATEQEIQRQRAKVAELKQLLQSCDHPQAQELIRCADMLIDKSVWIIGGDGWAYDIGFGGLDHVLASHVDVNVMVLDTEVYSNTGGQASKSTPRGAVAKFASTGKSISKKDLGMIAMAYGHVYVAQIALGAHPLQALRAIHEAQSYSGPSLILAYSQCIAHGIDLSTGMSHQKEAVNSGYWPLYRYDPRLAHAGAKPFQLDCRKPSLPFSQFAAKEARYSMLQRSHPARFTHLMNLAQRDIDDRWHYYEQIANVERSLADFMDQVPQ